MVQYSIDINFTLTIMPQRESYYHQTTITARVFNTCEYFFARKYWLEPVGVMLILKFRVLYKVPPEITAQCLDRAIVFSVAGSSQTQTLWEVGVDKTPLTSELAVQRGYLLSVQDQKIVLEIPLFSIGYTYEVRLLGQPWLCFVTKIYLPTKFMDQMFVGVFSFMKLPLTIGYCLPGNQPVKLLCHI